MIPFFLKFILMLFSVLFLFVGSFFAKVEVHDDVSQYNEFIGSEAREQYQDKWGMDEDIFPKKIVNAENVVDYKMVYYNQWDAQYLSYLVIDYTDQDYEKECNRLKKYESTDYIGYYGVTGFNEYTLLAMYADEYQGFVYALTDDDNRIIYVELIFCNYFYDLEYENYIDVDYLPDGFDATIDNPYQKEMLTD